MGQNTLASASLSCMMYVTTASRFALASVLRSSTYACVFRSLLLLASCENAGAAITSGRTNNTSGKGLFRSFISFHPSYFDHGPQCSGNRPVLLKISILAPWVASTIHPISSHFGLQLLKPPFGAGESNNVRRLLSKVGGKVCIGPQVLSISRISETLGVLA